MEQTIRAFQALCKKQYGDYAFASGYLGSMLNGVFKDLPKDVQDRVQKQLTNYIIESVNQNG